jgi:hypothetical protein
MRATLRSSGLDGRRYRAESKFFASRITDDSDLSLDHLEPAEVGNVLEARWLDLAELPSLPMSNEHVPSIAAQAVESLTR